MFGIPAFNMTGFGGIGSISQAIGALDENLQFTDNLSLVKGTHNVRTGFQISRQDYFQITNFNGNPTFTFDGRYTGLQANGIGLADFLLGVPGARGRRHRRLHPEPAHHVLGRLRAGRLAHRAELHAQLRAALRVRALAGGARQQEPRLRAGTGTDPAGRTGRSPRHRRSGLEQLRSAASASRGGRRCSRTSSCAAAPASTTRPTISTRSSSRARARRSSRRRRLEGDPAHAEPVHARHDAVVHQLAQREPVHVRSRQPDAVPDAVELRRRRRACGRTSCWKSNTPAARAASCRSAAISTSRRIDPTGTIPIVQRVPYPQFGFMLMTYNGGWSSYNALTTKLEKRFSKGLYFLGSYTWQKSLDLGATDEFSTISAEFKKWDKGHSTFDVPHRFVGQLGLRASGRPRPRADGRHAGCARGVLGGWQVSGIATFSQGQFQTPTLGSDWLLHRHLHAVAPERHRRSDRRPAASRRLSESRGLRFPARRAGQPDSRAGQRRAATPFSSPASTTGTSVSSRTSASATGSTRSSAGRRSTRGTTRSSVPRTSTRAARRSGASRGCAWRPRRMQFGLRLTF